MYQIISDNLFTIIYNSREIPSKLILISRVENGDNNNAVQNLAQSCNTKILFMMNAKQITKKFGLKLCCFSIVVKSIQFSDIWILNWQVRSMFWGRKPFCIHSSEVLVPKCEQKGIQRRVEKTKHQQHHVDFVVKRCPLFAGNGVRDKPKGVWQPADENSQHEYRAPFGCLDILQIHILLFIRELFGWIMLCIA